MSAKQRILKVIRESSPDLTFEEAIYKLELLRRIEIGTAQLGCGEGIDHEEMFAKWCSDADTPKVVAPRRQRPESDGGFQ